MCGRFALTMPGEAIAAYFEAEASDVVDEERLNICPTQDVPVVVTHRGARHLVGMRWGFLPHWYKAENDGPLLINARAETIAEKPAFRDACRRRRCLIPADGFFEWTASKGRGKEPWYVYPGHGGVIAFAGIWQSWTSPQGKRHVTTAIVTTEANDALSEVHHRMPVIISPENWALWLGEVGHGASALMRPAANDLLCRHRVGPQINSMKGQGSALRDPL